MVNVRTCGHPEPGWGDVSIRRGTVLGNPYLMRHEGERDEAVASYWRLLRRGGSAHEIGRESRLSVHETSGRVSHTHRMAALRQLARRVEMGESLRLVCACRPRACHGSVIREWIERRPSHCALCDR